MPVLPYQQQVSLGGGGQQPYGQATAVSDAIGRGLTAVEGGVEKINAAALQQQDLHDAAAVNDVYANRFSPAVRSALYDPKDGYFAKQGADAVRALPQTEGVVDQIRTQTRATLQNENQQRMFDAMSRRHLEMEMDGAYRHADRENQVWQAHTSDAVVKDKMASAVDHFNDPKYADGAIAGGLYEIQQYGLSHGQSAEMMAERAKEFVRNTRTAVAQRLLVADPLAARDYVQEHAAELAGPNMAVLEHQVKQAVLPIEARTIADKVISGATPGASGTAPSGFDSAVQFVLSKEGGYNASDGNSGAPVNFGINQKANPDVDVKSLTKQGATQIYRDRYWNAIGGDNLPPGAALMAMDAAVNQGVPFAKQILAQSGGDVTKMAQLRRAKYQEIIAADPSQAKNQTAWMGRVDAAEQQAATVGAPTANATGMRAQMLDLIGQAEQEADRTHPGDPVFRDMAVAQVKAHFNNQIANQVAVQQQAHGILTQLATGTGKGSAKPTTLDDLLAAPGARTAWTVVPPESQRGILAMLDHNQKEAIGISTKSDPAAVQEAFRRVHLPDDDPQKIRYAEQLVPLFKPGGGPGSKGINREDYDWLKKEVDQQQSVSGRSLTKDLQNVRTSARTMLAGSIIGRVQPELAEEASYRFSLDVQNQVDAYIKAGKDPRALLTPGSAEYLLKPERVMSFLQTPQQAVAAQAEAIRKGSAPKNPTASGKVGVAPARVASDAEYAALESGTQFVGPDGKVRVKP
jgi:lysozyme family protein